MASDSVRALGLMSGTSMDGIDAAILQSDGCEITAFGPTHYKAYSHEDRVLLRRAMDEARDLTSREARPTPPLSSLASRSPQPGDSSSRIVSVVGPRFVVSRVTSSPEHRTSRA